MALPTATNSDKPASPFGQRTSPFGPPKPVPHQALRDYISGIRGSIAPDDLFGLQLIRLAYRDKHSIGKGIFHRVKAVHDAVIAAGGNINEARQWTAQVIRWKQSGKAIEPQLARYEIDPNTSAAMESLCKLLDTLPSDMLQQSPFRFGQRNNPLGGAVSSPFGSNNNQPPAKPSSPFGQKPSPFGAKPPAPPQDLLPHHIGLCFDALAAPAEPPKPTTSPDGLFPSAAVHNTEPLPDTLEGLIGRWYQAVQAQQDIQPILSALGKLGDLRIVDHVHQIRRDEDNLSDGIKIFELMGGDIGVAGLLSLLPLPDDKRDEWLEALCVITTAAMRNKSLLSQSTLDAIFAVVAPECAPNVPFNYSVHIILGALQRPEAYELLWQFAGTEDMQRRRAVLYGIAQGDPGQKLEELLYFMDSLPDVLPPQRFPSPFGTRNAPIPAPDPVYVGIPYERLEAALVSWNTKIRLNALRLVSYVQDDRVIPLLVNQLTRRVPKIREVALKQLRRLKATSAADAVAALMVSDPILCQQAADTLCEWQDPRCVPVLLEKLSENSDPVDVINRMGKLGHPAFDAWLIKTVQQLSDQYKTDAEAPLTAILEALMKIEYAHIRTMIEMLMQSEHIKVRQVVVTALCEINEDWVQPILRRMASDPAAIIAYRAAALCTDPSLIDELLADHQETRRIIAIRMLWRSKDVARLESCLHDKSSAVRDIALWALCNLQNKDTIPLLKEVVEKQDKIDMWHQNPALIAWRALVRMAAV